MAYRLILEPERYDVVVAPNLYGDILSDAGAALVGGLGIIGSANCGERFCLAEPVHGSAPGHRRHSGIANPIAAVSAAALLLERVGLADEAGRVEEALAEHRENGPRTPDRGGRRDRRRRRPPICYVESEAGFDRAARFETCWAETLRSEPRFAKR